jgi:hypothetical protein
MDKMIFLPTVKPRRMLNIASTGHSTRTVTMSHIVGEGRLAKAFWNKNKPGNPKRKARKIRTRVILAVTLNKEQSSCAITLPRQIKGSAKQFVFQPTYKASHLPLAS